MKEPEADNTCLERGYVEQALESQNLENSKSTIPSLPGGTVCFFFFNPSFSVCAGHTVCS